MAVFGFSLTFFAIFKSSALQNFRTQKLHSTNCFYKKKLKKKIVQKKIRSEKASFRKKARQTIHEENNILDNTLQISTSTSNKCENSFEEKLSQNPKFPEPLVNFQISL